MSQNEDDAPDAREPLPRLSEVDREELLRLARQTLIQYLGAGAVPSCKTDRSALLEQRATFVTLTVRDSGMLRGCRGEVVARQSLIESVINMAVAAATDDPRFPVVDLAEVPGLHIEISVLSPMEPIEPGAVEIGRHGLMIVKGRNAGLLLPQVPIAYRWDREEFLDAVCRKAGLPLGTWRSAGVQLYGFECEVWGERD
ncbi:MAG: AmmeMemoRadiSam system protein A [Gemmatimonadota bacterium]|nr:MAG: AmmeMemoRadiSam system protein A [Gemmatimonadota bacterium]